MRLAVALAFAALGGLVLSVGGSAQTLPQATFRAGIDLVEVDVSVLDKDRRPVRGLTAGDFTIFEDGKQRPVAAFSAVDVPAPPAASPADAAWTREVSVDTVTNTLPEEGRLIVILMDRSIPDGYATLAARDVARAAVKEMGPNDVAAIVNTGSGVPHDFTNDRSRLLAAIDGGYPAGEASDVANDRFNYLLGSLLNPVSNPGLAAMNNSAECLCGACVMDAIGRVADSVREVTRRRKSMLFVGREISIETVESACVDPVRKARDRMFRALDTASLTVHSIDPSGLETLAPMANALGGESGRRPPPSYNGRANLVRQGNLGVLPDRTGGRVVKNTNTPAKFVADIIHESDMYYLLGFQPAKAPDGKPHDIKVKVDRRGVDVMTRREYVAGPSTATSVVAAAAGTRASGRGSLEDVLPRREGVSLTASATTFATLGTRVPVLAVALDVRHDATGDVPVPLALVPPLERVEVVTGVFTMAGRPISTTRQTLSVQPRTFGVGGAVTYEVLQRVPIKPGSYELRITIANQSRRQTGSVHAFVDVPDYAKDTFSLTDIVMHSPGARPSSSSALSDAAPAPPTARRVFDRRERPHALIRVLQGEGAAAVAVTVASRIVDTTNRRRFGQEATLPSELFTKTGVSDYDVTLPLSDLEPGDYLLTMDARAPLGSAQKQVRFTVR